MKYEAVFGDQSLFDGGPEDAECVAIDGTRDQLIFYKDIAVGDYYSFFDRNSSHWSINNGRPCYSINSMRRIIQEPKRWTVEDQKAGRLPDVGAEFQTSTGKRKCVITEGKFIFTVNDDAIEVYTLESAMPLETPEEKAERARKEWCRNALDSAGILSEMKRYDLKRLGEYIGSIHDALLSGTLSVPTKGNE